MTAFGQHSMAPVFYTDRASVAPHAPRARHPQWVKLGENPNMPYPRCGRSVKNLLSNNNDALVSQSMGFLYDQTAKWLHCACIVCPLRLSFCRHCSSHLRLGG